MEAVFVELPAFERHRADYLDDEAFQSLQNLLMMHPEAGNVISGTGGLRKLRFADPRRGKGKRSGLRVRSSSQRSEVRGQTGNIAVISDL